MKKDWKNISVKKIAELAKVSTATVDRVLHGRKGTSKSTIRKVNDAVSNLKMGIDYKRKKILLFSQSGNSFNQKLE